MYRSVLFYYCCWDKSPRSQITVNLVSKIIQICYQYVNSSGGHISDVGLTGLNQVTEKAYSFLEALGVYLLFQVVIRI